MSVTCFPFRLELFRDPAESDLSLGLQVPSGVGHMGALAGVCRDRVAGKVTYDYVILRVQTPAVLRISKPKAIRSDE